jgi:SAM-dependent methyltransferase
MWQALATGTVVEIGAGSGLNLPYYGPQVERLYALDPSAPLLRMAQRAAAREARTVEWLEGQAEAIPLGPGIADTVVTTWTLCSIADPIRALGEVRRVLKPGGRLLFIEHGQAPDPGVRRWQARLTPTWRRVAGGCHLDRPIDGLLLAAGLELETLSTGYGVGPRPFAYLYRGMARPAGEQPAQAPLTRGHILTRTEVGHAG